MENNTAATHSLNTRHILASETNAIAETAVYLAQGELVVFPTDTVYGVGVDAFNAEAILKLYDVKQRPLDKGIPILLADFSDITKVAADYSASRPGRYRSPLAWRPHHHRSQTSRFARLYFAQRRHRLTHPR